MSVLDCASEPHFMEAPPTRVRVAVVDDSPTFLEVVCALLEREEAVDVIARGHDGLEALELVYKLRPDLLIMDIDMPELDGINAAFAISKRFPHTRIALMSADDSPELQADCVACGAAAFVQKSRFRESIAELLEAFSL